MVSTHVRRIEHTLTLFLIYEQMCTEMDQQS